MLNLINRQKFNQGKRPSEHHISKEGFLSNHGGSISHNFFELEQMDIGREVRLPNAFSIANTNSNDYFMRECRRRGIRPHPARMPLGLAAFFIQFLSDENDLVLDPFAGSNTSGFAAEVLGRKWISIEVQEEYIIQSKTRFTDPILTKQELPLKIVE